MDLKEKIVAKEIAYKYIKSRWGMLIILFVFIPIFIYIENWLAVIGYLSYVGCDMVLFVAELYIKELERYSDECQEFFKTHDCYLKNTIK